MDGWVNEVWWLQHQVLCGVYPNPVRWVSYDQYAMCAICQLSIQ